MKLSNVQGHSKPLNIVSLKYWVAGLDAKITYNLQKLKIHRFKGLYLHL
jgi:hypothetical protein